MKTFFLTILVAVVGTKSFSDTPTPKPAEPAKTGELALIAVAPQLATCVIEVLNFDTYAFVNDEDQHPISTSWREIRLRAGSDEIKLLVPLRGLRGAASGVELTRCTAADAAGVRAVTIVEDADLDGYADSGVEVRRDARGKETPAAPAGKQGRARWQELLAQLTDETLSLLGPKDPAVVTR